MDLTSYQAILRPVVSEKSTMLADQGKYVFKVAPTANKIQIRQAVEAVFASKKVQVVAVNVIQTRGKLRRLGRHSGMTRTWKKAIVTLKAGQKLDLFEGV